MHTDPETAPEVAEQTAPVGGGDHDGDMPRIALPTVVAGSVTTREQPTLEAAPGVLALAAGECLRLLGRATNRRRVHLSSDKAVIISTNQQQAASGFGFRLPADLVWSPAVGVELWVFAPAAGGAASVTYWAELDAG